MSKKPSAKTDSFDFEAALSELEKLVERLEKGDQSLETSLKDFEHGIALARQCQQRLKEAEQRVEVLLQKEGEPVTEPFEPKD